MADFNDEKTVIVDRDRTDRTSPVGWILLLVALLVIAFFLMMGGTRLFNNNASDGTGDRGSSVEDANTPFDTTNPTIDSTTPEGTDQTQTPGPAQ